MNFTHGLSLSVASLATALAATASNPQPAVEESQMARHPASAVFERMYWGQWHDLEQLHTKLDRTKPTEHPELRALYDAAGFAASYERKTVQSDQVNATCMVLFRGDRIRWLGAKGPDHGRADVYVDGKKMTTVDSYARTAEAGVVLFDHGELDAESTHQLKIVIRRDKHPDSAGRMQRIHAFETGELVNYYYEIAAEAEKELELITAGKKPYLKPQQWKPVAYKAKAPEGGVSLTGGPLRESFDRNLKYLNQCFAKVTRSKDGKTLQWGGWDSNLPGSGDGKMLGAAAHALRWGADEDMREIVDQVVASVRARQRPDGYCMAFPEEHMSGSKHAWYDERRNYARNHLTRGMVAAAKAGNPHALPVMRRFYDWFYDSPYYSKQLAGPFNCNSSHNCNNANDGSLLMYFSPAGKPEDLIMTQRYLVQDFFLEESAKADPLSLCFYPYHTAHCYVLLAYKFWLDLYRGTGDPKFLAGAQGGWQIVHDRYLNHGTIAICEAKAGNYPPGSYYLQHKASTVEKHRGPKHPGETCGSVFWIDINHRLLQLFPEEAKYADLIESAILNDILAVQDPEGNIRYHAVHVGGKAETHNINTCCEVFAAPLISSLPQYLYSIANDGLYVNLYAPSSITFKQGRRPVALKTQTGFPVDGKVEIKVADGAGALKLRVRIPGWADADVAVQVNGAAAATGKPGSYVTIDRKWKSGDTVTFVLPMAFHTQLYTGFDQHPDHQRYSLTYGPLLMTLVGADDLDIPAAELPGRLEPITDRPLLFSIEGKAGVHYQPYWQVQTETFNCFPTMR